MILISLIMVLLVIGIGFTFLYLGFLMFKKKPLLITSNVMTGIAGITFLMILIGILNKVIASISQNWGLLLFVPVYIGIFLFIKKLLGDLIIFNIEEQGLYRSIAEALKVKGLNFERWHTKISVPSINTEITVSSYEKVNTAILFFKKSADHDADHDLVGEINPILKQMLSKRSFNKFSLVGLIYVIIGVLVLLVSVWMAISIFVTLSSGT